MRERILWGLLVLVAFIAGGAITAGWMFYQRTPQVADVEKAHVATPPAIKAPPILSVEPLQPVKEEYQEVIEALHGDFVDAQQLLAEPLTPQSLPGVLSKLGSKVRIFSEPFLKPDEYWKPGAELLPHGIVYWRLPNFNDKQTAAFLSSWSDWRTKGDVTALVVDLRFFQSPNDFDGAADCASLFTAPNTPLFTVQGLKYPQKVFTSQRQPLDIPDKMPILVLTNPGTRGAGEVLAYMLQRHAKALIVGQSTAGEAGVYTEKKMHSGRYLRVAVAMVQDASGENLLGKPLVPDILTTMSAADEMDAYKTSYEHGAGAVIVEVRAIPHTNEASLVKGISVELENQIAAQGQSVHAVESPVEQDMTLKTAIDIARGVFAYYEKPSLPATK